jgi:transcriptional regulator with XRE-family HTH domain
VPGRGPDQIDKYVARRIRMRRIMLGLSQEDVASTLGLTFQQVQKYEKGVNRISAGRLLSLAQMLEVPLPYFFEDAPGTGHPNNKTCRPSHTTELLTTRTDIEMAQAFARVRKARVRRCLVAFVEAIADGGR